MQWPDLLDRPRPEPDRRIPYGKDLLQHVDLWLPAGRGLHPVVLMVHGGCWQTDIADAGIMNHAADALRSDGIAVWNIEYRGVDRAGGGFPGTFLDVADAADMLRGSAAELGLRLDPLVAFGHSAGGHLALWLAARERLMPQSALYRPDPIAVSKVICVGGLPDLEAAQVPPGDTCGAEAVRLLTGQTTAQRSGAFAECSPAHMMPFSARQLLINTGSDPIAPPAFAEAYEAKARASGQNIEILTIRHEGHVELIAPGSASFAAACREIRRAQGLQA